ncbi:MAG: hypothetical protein GY803_22370 [Chloroflexi bacterium]|nr:hypothetical protein [Chloroflexota bacterium]
MLIRQTSFVRLLEQLDFRLEEGTQSTIVEAVKLLQQMNENNKRKLPDDAPLGFIPKKLRPLVEKNGEVSKRAWECALLTTVRNEIKAGNIFVQRSKRFGRFDDFFIEDAKWEKQRESFFDRADLPAKAEDVPEHLTQRLNQAYDIFWSCCPRTAMPVWAKTDGSYQLTLRTNWIKRANSGWKN